MKTRTLLLEKILKHILITWFLKKNHFKHTLEGLDDITSHIKSSLLGSSVSFPIKKGVPLLGIWQGIYLCEHRNIGVPRKLIITTYGEL